MRGSSEPPLLANKKFGCWKQTKSPLSRSCQPFILQPTSMKNMMNHTWSLWFVQLWVHEVQQTPHAQKSPLFHAGRYQLEMISAHVKRHLSSLFDNALHKKSSYTRLGTSLLCSNFHLLCYAALLKFSPIMLKIILTLLHCAQHYAHLQCKKSYYQTVAYKLTRLMHRIQSYKHEKHSSRSLYTIWFVQRGKSST